jgi:PsbP-like protein
MDNNLYNEQFPINKPPLKSNIVMKINNKKFLALLVGILVITVVALCYLYYRNVKIKKQLSPINSESLSSLNYPIEWKTYTNVDYGYSVNYPSSWEVVEAHSNDGNNLNEVGSVLFDNELNKITFMESNPTASQGIFIISVEKNPNKYTTATWADNFIVPLITDPSANLAKIIGDVKVDNIEAKKFSVSAFDYNTTIIGLVRNDFLYKYNFTDASLNGSNNDKNNTIYDQILSSFRFID